MVTQTASYPSRSGKNKVKRVLVFREPRATFPFGPDQGTGHGLSLSGVCIHLLKRVHDQPADGCAGTLRSMAEQLVNLIREVDCDSNFHDVIMSFEFVSEGNGRRYRAFPQGLKPCALLLAAKWRV
jgi:hypothetical protein